MLHKRVRRDPRAPWLHSEGHFPSPSVSLSSFARVKTRLQNCELQPPSLPCSLCSTRHECHSLVMSPMSINHHEKLSTLSHPPVPQCNPLRPSPLHNLSLSPPMTILYVFTLECLAELSVHCLHAVSQYAGEVIGTL